MFTVEGIIGAGKSTLCHHLQEAGFIVGQEPIDQWNIGPYNLLTAYYNNPSKYAYLFQCHVLDTLVHATKDISPPPGFAAFQERSIDSNALFTKLQHQLGHMDDIEYAMYMQQYLRQRAHPKCRVTGRIFLDIDPTIAMERVQSRARDGESTVTLQYQEKLNDLHQEWKQNEMNNGRPILVINTVENDVRSEEVIRAIRDWIKPLLP